MAATYYELLTLFSTGQNYLGHNLYLAIGNAMKDDRLVVRAVVVCKKN